MMRVLVCGSRTFEDQAVIDARLDEMHELGTIDLMIEGGAQGADSLAARWAIRHNVPGSTWEANWKSHGKKAGVIRNHLMFRTTQPHVVLAFVDKPLQESRGTAHMVSVAREAGCPVEVIEVQP